MLLPVFDRPMLDAVAGIPDSGLSGGWPFSLAATGLSGRIVLGSPDWIGPAVLLAALVLAAVALGYAAIRRSWSRKLGLIGLKTLGVMLLAFCLLNPLGTFTRVKPGENIVLLVADNSASLQINGKSARNSRGEQLKKLLLNKEAEWQVRLGQDFDVRRYIVGERLTPAEDFTPLSFDAAASSIVGSLQSLHDRFAGNPLAGIILFSDCNATDADLLEKTGKWVPIYCVLPDAPESPSDLAIGQVSLTRTAFEDAPVTVQARVRATDDFKERIYATLEPLGGGEDRQASSIPVGDPEKPIAFRFQLRPRGTQASFYRLRISDAPPAEEGSADAAQRKETKEATLANNERLLTVERDKGPYRVLYVGGRPNWEHKFLGRALAEDNQVALVSLIRIAKKEAKFDFRGRAGESGNSLFRGFNDREDAETESYDQPVLVRLNTRDEKELSDGFPKTKAELYEYHAIVLDDVEAEFFTHDQLSLLDRFVSERGGGLLMLGGLGTFRNGEWHKTVLRDSLPVYLDRPAETPQSELRLILTRDGWLQPWVRLRETEEKEQERLRDMPSFNLLSNARSIKPAAQVMAEVADTGNRRFPALVVQQYGKGHTGAVLIGDVWRWSLKRDEGLEDDLAKAWRQMLRWLVSDVPTRIETGVEWTTSGQSKAVVLKVRVRNKEFQPQDNAAVHLTIHPPEGDPLVLDAQPSLSEPGLFEALYVPRSAGAYRAEVRVDDEQGLQAGTAEIGWTSDPIADEFQVTTVNRELAERLAAKSGGEVLTESGLEKFIASLPYRNVPEQETQTFPLWHTPWLLLAALACFAAEWGLRRMGGLP